MYKFKNEDERLKFDQLVHDYLKMGDGEISVEQARAGAWADIVMDRQLSFQDMSDDERETEYNDAMLSGLQSLPEEFQDRLDIAMELTNDDEDLATALANSQVNLKDQNAVDQFIKRKTMQTEDFNKELHEMQLLAGIGTGIYGGTKTSTEKQYKVGDGMVSGTDSVSESDDDKVCGTNSNKDATTDIDATLYFPKGANNEVSDSAGPASAKQGDNAMQKSSMSDLAKLRKLAGVVKEDVSSDTLVEGKRLVGKKDNNGHLAKIYYDSDWQEYCVKLYIDGVHQGEDSDYHTDDKEDAFDTAEAMVKPRSNTVNEGYLAFYNMLQDFKKSKGL